MGLTKYFWVSYLIFFLNYSALFNGQEGQVGHDSRTYGDQDKLMDLASSVQQRGCLGDKWLCPLSHLTGLPTFLKKLVRAMLMLGLCCKRDH